MSYLSVGCIYSIRQQFPPCYEFAVPNLNECRLRSTSLVYRVALLYTSRMIKSFKHGGLEAFFKTGTKAGIQPHQASRIARQLKQLNRAKSSDDMNAPGWRLHRLSTGHWSIWVNGNWRITFSFDSEDVVLVDYRDYH